MWRNNVPDADQRSEMKFTATGFRPNDKQVSGSLAFIAISAILQIIDKAPIDSKGSASGNDLS